MPMIQKYESYDAYYEIAEPLLALELWHGISKDYDNGEVIQKYVFCGTGRSQGRLSNECYLIHLVCSINSFRSTMKYSIVNNSVTRTTVPSTELHVTTLMIEVIVNRKQWQIQAHPVFGDLIFFEYVSNIRAKEGGFQRWKVFGYVTKFHPAELTPFTQFNRDLRKWKPIVACKLSSTKYAQRIDFSF